MSGIQTNRPRPSIEPDDDLEDSPDGLPLGRHWNVFALLLLLFAFSEVGIFLGISGECHPDDPGFKPHHIAGFLAPTLLLIPAFLCVFARFQQHDRVAWMRTAHITTLRIVGPILLAVLALTVFSALDPWIAWGAYVPCLPLPLCAFLAAFPALIVWFSTLALRELPLPGESDT